MSAYRGDCITGVKGITGVKDRGNLAKNVSNMTTLKSLGLAKELAQDRNIIGWLDCWEIGTINL